MLDRIYIEGLKTAAIIGIYDWEREQTQPLIFDLELSVPIHTAASSDAIEDTVDYKVVCDEIREAVSVSRFELLESLVEHLCELIFTRHAAVQKIELKVSKPQAVPETDTVGLKITRTR